MSRTKRWAVGLACVLAATVLSGCGGDDAVGAREYLTGVCGAVRDWGQVIEEKSSELQNVAAESTPEDVKDAIVSFLDDIISETDTLISGVEDAGVPDVENGGDIADTVSGGLEQVKSVFEDARDEIESVSTEDREEFTQGVQAAFSSLGESTTEVGESLDELNTDELDEAAENVDACQEIPEF